MARRKGNTWWVAGTTKGKMENLKISLDFLGAGKYSARVYQDGKNTSWNRNREDYEISDLKGITNKTQLKLFLAEGGGVCLKFELENPM